MLTSLINLITLSIRIPKFTMKSPLHFSRLTENVRKTILPLAVLLFAYQMLACTLVVGKVSDHYGVMFGMPKSYNSMDVAEALRTVRRSNWVQHNGYGQYGPLYFRTAWTYEKMDPLLSRGSDWKWDQARGRHYHASLLMVNLLSLAGLAFAISCLLTRNWTERLIGTSVLLTFFQFSEIWCWGILIAKPENFICLLSAVGTLWAWRMFVDDGVRWRPLVMTALFFGLAMATKLSTLVYLAVLPLCFLPRIHRDALSKTGSARVLDFWPLHRRILPGLAFLALIFVVYVGVGWPQNADFAWLAPYLRFMDHQNHAPSGTIPDMEWGRRLFQQGLPPLLGILLLSCVWRTPSKEPRSWWSFARALGFAAIPIVYMFGKRVASPSEHYLMQYMASAFVMAAAALSFLWPREGKWATPAVFRPWVNLGLLIVALAIPRVLPHQWGPFSYEMIEAKQKAQLRFDFVSDLQRQVPKIYVDPYVSHDPNLGSVFWTYRANLGLFREDGPEIMVLSPVHYDRFLENPPNFYTQNFFRSWKVVREFYQIFVGKDQVTSPDGREWIRSEFDGLDVWKRQPLDGE